MRWMFVPTIALLWLVGLSCGDETDDPSGPSVTLGSVEVVLTMSGEDLGPDGSLLSFDNGPWQALVADAPMTFAEVAAGYHVLELAGYAQNCTVAGDNPRSVRVSGGQLTRTDFAVTCVLTVGELRVKTSTSGSDLDADGYSLSVDDLPIRPLGINGWATFSQLAVGDHEALLLDVSDNCRVSGDNPRTLSVPFNSTVVTDFRVTCVNAVGTVLVSVQTTGVDFDSDGYVVTIDGERENPLDANGQAKWRAVSVGEHQIDLLDVADHCTVQGENPLAVSVAFREDVEAEFEVVCGRNTADELIWPIDCVPGEMCYSRIGYPDIDGDGKAFDCGSPGYTGHQGTDIGFSWEQLEAGMDVLAAAPGEVLWVFDGKYDRCPNPDEPDCQSPGTTVCTDSGDYCGQGSCCCTWCFAGGNVVVIRHTGVQGVFATRYDHLKRYSILVSSGETVEQGQKIAEAASAGNSSGPHLHFEVWGSGYYQLADPWSGQCGPNTGESLWAYDPPWAGE